MSRNNGGEPSANPVLTMLEFTPIIHIQAERLARKLGYTQTAYTTTSDIWGLFCLRDRPTSHSGVIIWTQEFGLIFMQDLDDLQIMVTR